MEKKDKRYEIQSNVRVPNMQDIQKAASDYFEEAGANDIGHDFVARNAKHLISPEKDNKFDPLLTNIKKEMMQLGKAIATEEAATESAIETDEPEDTSGTAVPSDIESSADII